MSARGHDVAGLRRRCQRPTPDAISGGGKLFKGIENNTTIASLSCWKNILWCRRRCCSPYHGPHAASQTVGVMCPLHAAPSRPSAACGDCVMSLELAPFCNTLYVSGTTSWCRRRCCSPNHSPHAQQTVGAALKFLSMCENVEFLHHCCSHPVRSQPPRMSTGAMCPPHAC